MIEVRVATAETVAELDRRYPEPGRPVSRHVARLELQARGEATYLVAFDASEPIGWALLVWKDGFGELDDVSVAEHARRRGAGTALLRAADEAARGRGYATIELSVSVANPYNDAARRLYAAAGYVDTGREPFDEGWWYWTPDGERHWEGEPHLRLVKRL